MKSVKIPIKKYFLLSLKIHFYKRFRFAEGRGKKCSKTAIKTEVFASDLFICRCFFGERKGQMENRQLRFEAKFFFGHEWSSWSQNYFSQNLRACA